MEPTTTEDRAASMLRQVLVLVPGLTYDGIAPLILRTARYGHRGLDEWSAAKRATLESASHGGRPLGLDVLREVRIAADYLAGVRSNPLTWHPATSRDFAIEADRWWRSRHLGLDRALEVGAELVSEGCFIAAAVGLGHEWRVMRDRSGRLVCRFKFAKRSPRFREAE